MVEPFDQRNLVQNFLKSSVLFFQDFDDGLLEAFNPEAFHYWTEATAAEVSNQNVVLVENPILDLVPWLLWKTFVFELCLGQLRITFVFDFRWWHC